MNATSIYNGTPTISVIDNRGLSIRILEYNRVTDGDPVDEYITRNTHTPLGSMTSSMDPRLFSQYQLDNRALSNIRYSSSLRGEVLRTENVDAGQKIGLFDIEGRPIWSIDANGTQTAIEYDVIGRPTAVFEKQDDKDPSQCRERYMYGENEINAQANNLCGQLVRHYETAGRIQTESFSLDGMPLYQSRQLLKDMGQPSDWSMGDEDTWGNMLIAETYDTSWQYDAQGKMIAQTDAKGNLQKVSYNIEGQQKAVSLTLRGQAERSIVNWVEYNAAGQVQRTKAGNGIVTEYTYEESTQRLIRKKDSRGLSTGEGEVLQDYRYEYDPIGNILSMRNEADSVRFFRNQIILPKRQYTYDALYQLVSSSGRESDTLRQFQSTPSLITPILLDDSQYVNYYEKYSYDRSGNLLQLSHHGAIQYTRDIYVDSTSNRGVWKEKTPDIETLFDKAGNQKELHSGIPLEWDTRHQLSHVNMVVREEEDNDWEGYLYDSSGMRIVKRDIRKAQNTTQTGATIYLPSLELRTRQTGDSITESLQVITVGAGTVQVRVLHWEDDTQPDGIENNQYRYSINDHLQSSILELDGHGQIISKEEFYPYGGTALWAARTKIEANYKTIRYSGKERDATGLYYYGYRYYIPWLGRWLNPDPAGTVDGLNLYRMVRNNPINLIDPDGNAPKDSKSIVDNFKKSKLDFKEDKDKAHDWGVESYKIWLRTISLAEHRAIDKYTGGEYRVINNYLRFYEGKLGMNGVLDPTIREMDKALERAKTPDTMKVYRRVGETAFGLEPNSLRVGNEIVREEARKFAETFINTKRKEHAFMSTSVVNQPVNVFPILLHITVPKGSHGAYIESISQKPEEMEFLLARGYSYKIHGISTVNEKGREVLKVSADLIKEKQAKSLPIAGTI